MSASSPTWVRHRAGARSGVPTAIVLCLLLLLSSCREEKAPPATTSQAATVNEQDASAERCERMLDNLLDGLAPGRFGISADRGDQVNTLNNWREQCADPETFSSSPEDAELREQLLPEDENAQTLSERYSDQDAGYIRNTMLAKDLLDATLSDERTDLRRAVSLFYQVVLLVDLRLSDASTPPLSPYETLVFGMGTAADRAWLYGMILRQLRLDAVVIRPRTASPNETGAMLVGVIVPEEGVYLFDFQLGLPIVSPSLDDDRALPGNPITLAAARENDEVFRQYDFRSTAYPITAEQLSDVEVLAIGESSTWSPRLGLLQAALPASLELFDGLGASSLREFGLIQRVDDAGSDGLWSKEDIKIWSYPEQVYRRALETTQTQQQQLVALGSILKAPYYLVEEQQGDKVVTVPVPSTRNLHQARIQQIQGEYASALKVYLRTRLAAKPVGGQANAENVYGADWAAFWAALVQYQQGEYAAAAQSADRYLKSRGNWSSPDRLLLAKSLAQQQQFNQAANVLARDSVRSPQRMGNQWLIGRWRKLAKGDADKPANEPAAEKEQPQTPQPSPPDGEQASEDGAAPETKPPRETPKDLPPGEEPPDERFEEPPTDMSATTDDAETGTKDPEDNQ